MRHLRPLLFAISLLVPSATALAHHGWSWTTGGNIELTGVIESVRLGNPHGILQVNVDGEIWTLEVGQPWRNERAGLKDGDLSKGVEIKAIGEPSAELSEKRMKVERLFLGDQEYILYPNRD
ncbi:MAG: DUF6152 family protein [Alphaproteobacteria bacterium]|nr:DUF6152 family protein [Alphaproteobacteria bacterium]